MFSKLALRSLAIAPQLQRQGIIALARPMTVRMQSTQGKSEVELMVENWKTLNEKYFGPERDLKNFPHPKQPEKIPSVRMGFLPETWFTAFYNKTGVSGPYMFVWGMIAFGLSKEIITFEHNFIDALTFIFVIWYGSYKYGDKIKASILKHRQDMEDSRWNIPFNNAKDSYAGIVKDAETAMWQEEGKKMLFDAKRENVGLQLEATYRQRMNEAYQNVKRRLDYQVEVINAQRRFEQEHMTNWIVNQVEAGITPQQEKESIAKCIADLKALAAKG